MSYDIEVSAAVRRCSQRQGGNFISAQSAAINPDVRAALLDLAGVAGYNGDPTAVSNEDLAALYATARKAPSAALGVAKRLMAKYSHNPLLDPVAAPSAPTGWPSYDPAHTQGLSDLERRVDAITRTQQGLARLSDLADIKRDLEAMAHEIPHAIAEALSNQQPTNLVLTTPSAPPVAVGITHNMVPDILIQLNAGMNVYIHGPAGSGKTYAGSQIAEALGLEFHATGKVESQYELLGFENATKCVRTPFREAFEHGGLFLFDELDRSNPSAAVALNMALANGKQAFPDGMVTRHKDFKCIAAGNTTLTGATHQYVSASQFDAASVERFTFLEFGYDEVLERALASNQDWCSYVQTVRAVVAEQAIELLVTPRATLNGCALLEAGYTWEKAAAATIWKGADSSTIEQITRAVDRRNVQTAARGPFAAVGAN